MRFRQLSLERCGRFEGCELDFRAGAPELHIIYGVNEAGKTTSMAAVADLLFGFEPRSRYNFLFDYPMLRIGAVLEEDDRVLSVRRRKANAGSLVDADDKQIDDGPLIAMLHGQTRDGFRLAFSLDHLRLREGGHEMARARGDVGQTLFAAGSGMTGIVSALAEIEKDAGAIWGPKRSQARSYTQAETVYEARRAQARERHTKPKAWTDAQTSLHAAESVRDAAVADRDALIAEQRQVERLRRIGPAMRRRAELLAGLAAIGDAPALPPAREDRVLAALTVMNDAERARVTAAALLGDVAARMEGLARDPAMLAQAEAVDDLFKRSGEMVKGAGDADRLTIERRIKEARANALRRDLGVVQQDLPPRLAVTRLRELARKHGEALAALRSIGEAEETVSAKLAPLERRLADAELTTGLAELVVATDAARRLGDDVDARCTDAIAAADAAVKRAADARVRLAPWSGDADALAHVAGIDEAELAGTEADLTLHRHAVRTSAEEEQRLAEEGARLELAREALADSGAAVAATELEAARARRDAQWYELRDGLRGITPLVDPVGSSDAYERAINGADDVADQRFALAEGSGQLGLLDQQASALQLRRAQALTRRDDARAAESETLTRWQARAISGGLPPFEPARLRAWLADRTIALDAQVVAERLQSQAIGEVTRRRLVRDGLTRLMPELALVDEALVPVLREAARRVAIGEARDAAYRADHAEMRQLSDALATHARQAGHRGEERGRAEREWQEAAAASGMSLAIDEGDARLSLIDELRVVVDEVAALDGRLRGIETNRDRFASDLAALWAKLDHTGTPELDVLRTRLDAARAGAATRATLETDRKRRADEAEAAQAARDAAVAGLTPVLVDFGGIAVEALDRVVQVSRDVRGDREALAMAEAEAIRGGEGYAIEALEVQWQASDPEAVNNRADALGPLLDEAQRQVTTAADAVGEARRAFAALDTFGGDAAGAIADAEQARAEMAMQAETYLLKRAQAITLRWAIERYRQERQDPLLLRASALFRRLTLGRFTELRIDHDAAAPRLLGVRNGGRQAIDVEAMSDGTADQLFLALRLAAAEQSVAAGVRLPFLADDLFINFDDDRARAGFEVLSDLAQTTQVLFFTHHAHLREIARDVTGAELHSECLLG